jgi:hypothetical protein
MSATGGTIETILARLNFTEGSAQAWRLATPAGLNLKFGSNVV